MVRFGVQIENHLGCGFDAASKISLEAERLGYDGLFICDHLMGRNDATAREPCLDPWVTLGALAKITTRLRLGTLVSAVGFRNPAILAKAAATLDHISRGRMQLSIGAGWYEPEYAAYGISFPRVGKRMQQLNEAIRIIKALWVDDKPSFTGESFAVKDAWCYPRPTQATPKIWVGGTGEKRLLRIVAEQGDGWNATGTSHQEYAEKLKVLESFCNAQGRGVETIERSYYASALTANSESEFARLFDKHYSGFRRPEETVESFGRRVRASGRSFVGTVPEVIERIDGFQKLGVTYLIFYFPDKELLNTMRLFAEHVIPSFSKT